jgi:hypothetical protein
MRKRATSCTKCGAELDNKNYSICKKCLADYGRDYRLARFSDKSRRVRAWAISTLGDHKRKGFNVLITVDELCKYAMTIDNCEYTDEPLNWFSQGRPTANSPSLDRLNNEDVLNIDNIRIISYKMNAMKRDLTFKDYIKHCKFMVDKFGDS